MNKFICGALISTSLIFSSCKPKEVKAPVTPAKKEVKIVKAGNDADKAKATKQIIGCGSCEFEVGDPNVHTVYVEIDKKTYPLSGLKLNDTDQEKVVCKAPHVLEAMITGELKNDKYVASFIEVIPDPHDHSGHDHGDHEGHDHGDHEGHDHGDHEGHDHK